VGYRVTPRPFEYSAFTGRWATPLAGAWIAGWLAVAGHLGDRDRPDLALGALVVALLALAAAGRYLGDAGVLSFPIMRRRGVNIEAVRGGREPAVWLVAHVDSKWQPVPMAVRAAGVVVLAIASIAALVLSIVQWRSGVGRVVWLPLVIVGGIGALPVIVSVVGDRGPGAVDNASGVATVLDAAEQLADEANVGVVITDAEELALAGAAAWARQSGRRAGIALNCDGVDDDGMLTVMYSGARPDGLVDALRNAAARDGERLRVMQMIPGVLTDSVALARAGWTTATLSRGSLRTLGRIHTMADDTTAMRGTAIAGAARVLAAAAVALSKSNVVA
jgi:hypothetical protein